MAKLSKGCRIWLNDAERSLISQLATRWGIEDNPRQILICLLGSALVGCTTTPLPVQHGEDGNGGDGNGGDEDELVFDLDL